MHSFHSSVSFSRLWLLGLLLAGLILPLRAEQFGNFTYSSNGEAITITQYTGSATEMVIPSTIAGLPVIGIDDGAFQDNATLISVAIPDGIEFIGKFAFTGCISLSSVDIPFIRNIPESAFAGCTSLKTVALPESVEQIGTSAFAGCTNLANVIIPGSVRIISNSAFAGCTALLNIVIPHECGMGRHAFAGCTSIATISFPGSLKGIPDSAFAGCTTLNTVIIPQGVEQISSFAFAGCTSLANVLFLGNTPPSIGADVFSNAAAGFTVLYYEGSSGFTSPDWKGYPAAAVIRPQAEDFYYRQDGDGITITGYAGAGGAAVVPGTIAGLPVRKIDGYAFQDNTSLTSLVISGGVAAIGPAAFSGCSNLANLVIPNSVTSIGDWALSRCSSLTSLILPHSVNSIGMGAFAECANLATVSLGANITSVARSTFWGCRNLAGVEIPSGVTSIGIGAFMQCTQLAAVRIPSSVTSIGPVAFYDCTSLNYAVFEGDAPFFYDSSVFGRFLNLEVDFTIYYREGRSGFTSPEWQGYPAVMLGAQPTLEEWRKQHFGEDATNSGDAADAADPDGDGLVNAEEFAAGTHPKNAASVFRIMETTMIGAAYTVEFVAQAGRRYELQRLLVTPDAVWHGVATLGSRETAASSSLTDSSAPPEGALYRVRATLP